MIEGRSFDRNLPLAAEGLDVGVAEEVHRTSGVFGARRTGVAGAGGLPGRIEGEVRRTSEAAEHFEQIFSVGTEGALGDEDGSRVRRRLSVHRR